LTRRSTAQKGDLARQLAVPVDVAKIGLKDRILRPHADRSQHITRDRPALDQKSAMLTQPLDRSESETTKARADLDMEALTEGSSLA
jgi:hypothetical protein